MADMPMDISGWTTVVGAVQADTEFDDPTKQKMDWESGLPRYRVRLIVLAPLFDTVEVTVAGDLAAMKPGTRVRAEGGKYKTWTMGEKSGFKLWVDALVPVENTARSSS